MVKILHSYRRRVFFFQIANKVRRGRRREGEEGEEGEEGSGGGRGGEGRALAVGQTYLSN
jgi:hypothetical protein